LLVVAKPIRRPHKHHTRPNRYDYERLHADTAFGALCELASDRLNGLVEEGGADLHLVVRQGADVHPRFHVVAATAVFLEFVRCQTGLVRSVFFAKDFFDTARLEGDMLLDAERLYLYRNRGRLTGPFDCVFAALDAWMTLPCAAGVLMPAPLPSAIESASTARESTR